MEIEVVKIWLKEKMKYSLENGLNHDLIMFIFLDVLVEHKEQKQEEPKFRKEGTE